jgi:DNA-binding response OmpR family regulator
MGNVNNQLVRILVVDRSQESGQRMRDTLLAEGFCCEYASNAASALTQARQHLPALMIVDTQLDACSGFDLVGVVRSEYSRHEIPAIFVSAESSSDQLDRSRKAGGIYFLSKPIDPAVLVELVDTALWMPHLVRRHIDAAAHQPVPKTPRVLGDKLSPRPKLHV